MHKTEEAPPHGEPVAKTFTSKPPPPKLTLKDAVKSAVAGLQIALRALIANKVKDADPSRLAIESAYEDAKNVASVTTLVVAAKQLQVAADMLANQSNTPAPVLAEVRTAAAQARKAAENWTPKATD